MNISGVDIKVVAIDFDGTIIPKHLYPNVGEPFPNAVETIHKLMKVDKSKLKIVLWSCRDKHSDPKAYDRMIDLCREYNLVFDAINDNIEDFKAVGVKSRKVIADMYIDDNAAHVDGNDCWKLVLNALCGE